MKHFISFCTFLLFSTLLFAQAERSLDECIRIAWKQNPSLRNSGIDIKEARMDYISSVASFLPRVSVSAEAGRNFGRSIDPNTNGYTNDTFDEGTVGLDMTLSLFEGFTRINRVRFEKMNRNRSEWALKERRNELACQVTDAYYKLLLEERMLDLALEQSRLSERYLKQTEAFVELGLKSVSDLQEVKARREGDIYRYQARQNGCRLALLRLKQLL
ncbi:TolC family protein, partial [Bacteroides fragilis]